MGLNPRSKRGRYQSRFIAPAPILALSDWGRFCQSGVSSEWDSSPYKEGFQSRIMGVPHDAPAPILAVSDPGRFCSSGVSSE